MRSRYLFALTLVLYFTCLIAVIGMLGHTVKIFSFQHGEKVVLATIIVASSYLAIFLQCLTIENKSKRTENIRKYLFLVFIFYMVMVIDFTLIDDSLGRNIFNIFKWNETAFKHFLEENTNFTPFVTIKLFINGYKNDRVSLITMLENIVGNVVVFMPFPFFAKIFFGKFSKWYYIFFSVLIVVVSVELLQFLFMTGTTDVDDVILNVAGAMLFYLLLNINCVSKVVSKVTLGAWETAVKHKV